MNLCVTAAEVPVEFLEIEAAHLAGDVPPLFSGLFDLTVPDAWVTLPALLQHSDDTSFADRHFWIVNL